MFSRPHEELEHVLAGHPLRLQQRVDAKAVELSRQPVDSIVYRFCREVTGSNSLLDRSAERLAETLVDACVLSAEPLIPVAQRPKLYPDPPLNLAPILKLEGAIPKKNHQLTRRISLRTCSLLPLMDPKLIDVDKSLRQEVVPAQKIVLNQPNRHARPPGDIHKTGPIGPTFADHTCSRLKNLDPPITALRYPLGGPGRRLERKR